jgi:hypothetical protein
MEKTVERNEKIITHKCTEIRWAGMGFQAVF